MSDNENTTAIAAPGSTAKGTVKLSDLIMQGAKISRKAKNNYLRKDPEGNVMACAIGCAYFALHNGKRNEVFNDYEGLLGDPIFELSQAVGYHLQHKEAIDPIGTRNYCRPLTNIVFDLNDYEGWSRPRIAAWLRKQGL